MAKIGRAKKQRKNCAGGVVHGGWHYAANVLGTEHDEAETVMNHDNESISPSWFNITSIQKSLSEVNENEKEMVIINNVLMPLTQIINEPNLICSALEKALILLNKKVPARSDLQPAIDDMECADSCHLPSVHDHEDDGAILIDSSIESNQTDSTIDSMVS